MGYLVLLDLLDLKKYFIVLFDSLMLPVIISNSLRSLITILNAFSFSIKHSFVEETDGRRNLFYRLQNFKLYGFRVNFREKCETYFCRSYKKNYYLEIK